MAGDPGWGHPPCPHTHPLRRRLPVAPNPLTDLLHLHCDPAHPTTRQTGEEIAAAPAPPVAVLPHATPPHPLPPEPLSGLCAVGNLLVPGRPLPNARQGAPAGDPRAPDSLARSLPPYGPAAASALALPFPFPLAHWRCHGGTPGCPPAGSCRCGARHVTAETTRQKGEGTPTSRGRASPPPAPRRPPSRASPPPVPRRPPPRAAPCGALAVGPGRGVVGVVGGRCRLGPREPPGHGVPRQTPVPDGAPATPGTGPLPKSGRRQTTPHPTRHAAECPPRGNTRPRR